MRSLPSLLTAALVAIVLSGCLPTPSPVEPEPHASPTPLFATEDEALAAAEEAYAAYLRVSDLIASEGGANPERIAPYVTGEWLQVELSAFRSFEATGKRIVGATTVTSTALQRLDQDHDQIELVVYSCSDVSGSRVIDKSGADVTPQDRPEMVNLQLTFVAKAGLPLKLDGSEPWSDHSSCLSR